MKKKIIVLLGLFMLIIPFLNVKAEDKYFVAGENIVSDDVYDHSVFQAGEEIESKGTIRGIAFLAGNTVDIKGNVEYGFAAGSDVNVSSVVDKDLFLAGRNIVISKDSKLNRDAYLAASKIVIKADVKGNVFAAASVVDLEDITIDGDLNVAANQVNIKGNVEIKGTLYVDRETLITKESNLKVSNKEIKEVTKVDFNRKLSDSVLGFLTLVFSAIILSLVFPKLFKKLDYELSVKDVFKKSFLGLGVLVIVPLLSLILLITTVGSIIGIVFMLLYVVTLMLSVIMSSYVIGTSLYTKVFNQKENVYVSLIIGICTLKVIEYIPVLGSLVMLFAFLYGLGLFYKLVANENK